MNSTIGHRIKVGFLAFLAVIGFDLFLHAGILSPLYSNANSFVLAPEEAFQRIPFGYLSFAILIGFMLWLMTSLEIRGWRAGLFFGLVFGAFVWGSLVLGLFSISTAGIPLLIGWFLGQTVELAVAAMVIGSGLANSRLRPLYYKVLIFFVAAVVLGIILQNIL